MSLNILMKFVSKTKKIDRKYFKNIEFTFIFISVIIYNNLEQKQNNQDFEYNIIFFTMRKLLHGQKCNICFQ